MRKRNLFLAAALIAAIGNVSAQSIVDAYNLSKTNSANFSARVSAMGGAFTSLGADPSAMVINPAGLGLYKSSEVSLTPSLNISSMNNTAVTPGLANVNSSASKTRMNLNNFNAIFNVMKDNDYSFVKGVTLGVGYNRESNLMLRSEATSAPTNISIADYYALQLTANNIDPNKLLLSNLNNHPFSTYNPGLWGAIEAFNNGILAHTTQAPWRYETDTRSIHVNDRFTQKQNVDVWGGMDSYDISAGVNLNNILYLGATIGFSSYLYSEKTYYTEVSFRENTGDLDMLEQWQGNTLSGMAFDLKLGAILEPTPGLRIGAAYHMGKNVGIENTYAIDQKIYYTDNTSYKTESPFAVSKYNIKGAPRLLTGISYAFRGFGILSFDWDRTWYNKMQINGLNEDPSQPTLNDQIRETYKPADNFKVGLEAYVGGGFFVRGGYGYYGSAWRYSENGYDDSVMSFSGGLGYKTNSFYIDLAYVHMSSKTQPYRFFFGQYGDNIIQAESVIFPKKTDSYINLTLGFRF